MLVAYTCFFADQAGHDEQLQFQPAQLALSAQSTRIHAKHEPNNKCGHAVEDESEDVSGEEDDADDEDFGKSRSKRKAVRPSPQSARPQHSRRPTSVSSAAIVTISLKDRSEPTRSF